MEPRPVSPAATADQNAEHQQQGSYRTATPPQLRPPKHIYATLASTLVQPMDAEQYYQCVLRELPVNHTTLQEWRKTKGGHNEWGREDTFLWEDTWEGTTDTFLEATATTYCHPTGDTQHSLHTLLALHSWKHHHTVTLHLLDHNPQRWTPEDYASTIITIQRDPENPTGYHLTWSNPARHPPASRTLQDMFATISAGLQEAIAEQQPDEEMPEAPPPTATHERPRNEPLAHPITRKELLPHHRTTPDCNGSRNLPQEWAIHNGTLRREESTQRLQAIRLHSFTERTETWTLPADQHHLLITIQGDAPVAPTEGDPITPSTYTDKRRQHPSRYTWARPRGKPSSSPSPPRTTTDTPANTGGRKSVETSSRRTTPSTRCEG